MDLPFGRTLVLACHDLSAFNPRGEATAKAEWRRDARNRFHELVRAEPPDVVLHHPHVTDSTRTWKASWNELERQVPSLRAYIGAGRYFLVQGARSRREDVLASTKRGPSLDFVVQG